MMKASILLIVLGVILLTTPVLSTKTVIKGYTVTRENGAKISSGACVKPGDKITVSSSGMDVKDYPPGSWGQEYLGCGYTFMGVCHICGGEEPVVYNIESFSGSKSVCDIGSCYDSLTVKYTVPSTLGEKFKVGITAKAASKYMWVTNPIMGCADRTTKTTTLTVGDCSSDADCGDGFCGSDCMCHSLAEEGWTHPNHNSFADSNNRRESGWGKIEGFSEDNPFDEENVNTLWEKQLGGSISGPSKFVTPVSFVEPNSENDLVAVYAGYDHNSTRIQSFCFPLIGQAGQYYKLKLGTFAAIHKITILNGSNGKVLREIPFVSAKDMKITSSEVNDCSDNVPDPTPSTAFENGKDDPAMKYMAFVPASADYTLAFLYTFVDYSKHEGDPEREYNRLAYIEKPWDPNSKVIHVTNIDQSCCGDKKDSDTLGLDDQYNQIISLVPIEHGTITSFYVTYLEEDPQGDEKLRGARTQVLGSTLSVFQVGDCGSGCQRKSYNFSASLSTPPLSGQFSEKIEFPDSDGTVHFGVFSGVKDEGGNAVNFTHFDVWTSSAAAYGEFEEETLLLSNPYYSSNPGSDKGFVFDIAGYARDKFYVRRVNVKESGDISNKVTLLGEYSLLGKYNKYSSMAKFRLKDYSGYYFMAVVEPGGQKIMFIAVPESGKGPLCSPSDPNWKLCKWGPTSLSFTAAGMIAAADLDGDGNDELILGGDDKRIHFMRWIKDTGLEQLGKSKELSGNILGIAVDDVDRDGFLDILVTTDDNKITALTWFPPCKLNFTVDNMVCAEDEQTVFYTFDLSLPRSGPESKANTTFYYSWDKSGNSDSVILPGDVTDGDHFHVFRQSEGDIDLSWRAGQVVYNILNVTPLYNGILLPAASCEKRDLLYVLGGNISPDLPAGKARPGEVSFTIEQKGKIMNNPRAGKTVPADVWFIADNINTYKHCKISSSYDGFGPGSEIALDALGDDGVYESWKFNRTVSQLPGTFPDHYRALMSLKVGTFYLYDGGAEPAVYLSLSGQTEYLEYVLGGSCGTTTDQKLLQPGEHSRVFKASYDEAGQTYSPRAVFMFRDLNDTIADSADRVIRTGPTCLAQTSFSTIEAPNCSVDVTPPGYACYDQPVEFNVSYSDSTGSPGEVTVNFGGEDQQTVTVNNLDTQLVSHQYTAKGNYSIRADAVGKESGARCSKEITFTVYDKREDVVPSVQPEVVCSPDKQQLVLTCTDQKGSPVPGDTVTGWSVNVNGQDKSSDCSAGSSTCVISLSGFDTTDFVYDASCHVSGTECYVYTQTTASTSGDFNCSLAGKPAEEQGAIFTSVTCTQGGSPLDCAVTRAGKIIDGMQSVDTVNCKGVKKGEEVKCDVTTYNGYDTKTGFGFEPSSAQVSIEVPFNFISLERESSGVSQFSFTPEEYGKTVTVSVALVNNANGFPEDDFLAKFAVVEEPGKCSEDCKYCKSKQACEANPACEWESEGWGAGECKYKQVGGLPEYPDIALVAVVGLFALLLLRRK